MNKTILGAIMVLTFYAVPLLFTALNAVEAGDKPNFLWITCEDPVFQLVTKWTNAEASRNSRPVLKSILSHVRFPFCSPSFLFCC